MLACVVTHMFKTVNFLCWLVKIPKFYKKNLISSIFTCVFVPPDVVLSLSQHDRIISFLTGAIVRVCGDGFFKITSDAIMSANTVANFATLQCRRSKTTDLNFPDKWKFLCLRWVLWLNKIPKWVFSSLSRKWKPSSSSPLNRFSATLQSLNWLFPTLIQFLLLLAHLSKLSKPVTSPDLRIYVPSVCAAIYIDARHFLCRACAVERFFCCAKRMFCLAQFHPWPNVFGKNSFGSHF